MHTLREILTAVSVLLALAPLCPAGTLTVDVGGGGNYADIQSAIDAAAASDTVLVKPGEYVIQVPISFKGKAIAVRSEAGAQTTTIRMGWPADFMRSSVVFFESGETEAAVLEGFTITDGWEAGVYCSGSSSPTLTNCTVSGNFNSGVRCSGSSPTINTCTFSENSGSGLGCSDNSSPTLTDCTISGNYWMGGSVNGVYCDNSSPTLTNCTVSGNSSMGLYCSNNSSPTLTDCTISGNSFIGVDCYLNSSPTLTNCTISGNSGGGLGCSNNSSPTLTDCTISGNSDSGVDCSGTSSPTLTNCTISGNLARLARYVGGGGYCDNSSPTFANCTISGNSGGGLYCSDNSSPRLTSCIVWGNAGESIGTTASTPVVTYSCIESATVWPGSGNINLDPEFCGWPASEVWVDASHAGPGTGTEADPYSHIASALSGYRLSLQDGSPCRGSRAGDKDMGAAVGACDGAGSQHCTVHLRPGTYPIEGSVLAHRVSVEGSGQETTTIEGTVYGLRTGAVVSSVKIIKGASGGIVVAPGEAPDILDCTISGNSGSGVDCSSGSPTLTNCTISGNSGSGVYFTNCTISGNSGSGEYCSGSSSPTLTNCTISGNSERGVYCYIGSAPKLTNCTISGNSGGGVYGCPGSAPELTGCTISSNSAQDGGGIHCFNDSKFTDCTISGNSANNWGGGACIAGSTTLVNCTISGNTASGGVGGVSCIKFAAAAGGPPTLVGCTISGNTTPFQGGGLVCAESSPTLTNCTITGNTASWGNGGVLCSNRSSPKLTNCTISGNCDDVNLNCQEDSSPILTNCIVWGNTGAAISADDTSHPVVTYSCIRSNPCWPGVGNINTDPLFAGPGDFHLQAGSPAIDAGTSEGAPAGDIEGITRPQGAGIDIGAYEFSSPCPPAGDTHCLGLQVTGPEGGVSGTYSATATANDDSGDAIIYTFTAKRGEEAPVVVGPKADASANFDLGVGTWTISVDVDDDPACPDVAADARCSTVVTVVKPGGRRIPGDANGDGSLDISDAVATLGFLFLGNPTQLPCGDGSSNHPSNISLMDWQSDGVIDISDAVAMLSLLFLGGHPHTLAVPGAETTACVRIVGCPDNVKCP